MIASIGTPASVATRVVGGSSCVAGGHRSKPSSAPEWLDHLTMIVSAALVISRHAPVFASTGLTCPHPHGSDFDLRLLPSAGLAAQSTVQSVTFDSSLMNRRFPEMVGCAHVALSDTS